MNVPPANVSVLWRIHGVFKDIECTLASHPNGLELRVERGLERELFWRSVALSKNEALSLSSMLRERLVSSGWVLIEADGERRLRDQVAAASKPAA